MLLVLPLLMATAKDYVRRVQERLIAGPIIERLVRRYAGEGEVGDRLTDLLSNLRALPRAQQGYGPGNLVNLLLLVRGDLGGVDLSGLELRQVFLRDIEAHGANLTGSHLSESALADSFDYPMPLALSADGTYLAAGTAGGEVRLWRMSDRTPIISVPSRTGVIMSVALSGDGRLLASGSLDGSVRVWEAAGSCLPCQRTAAGYGEWR
jgi:WD40 repeat protein